MSIYDALEKYPYIIPYTGNIYTSFVVSFKDLPQIKHVIFNDPATIVYFTDDTKTVVKCQKGDVYDKEKGLAMALLKKYMGNNGSYNDVIKKWVK